MDLQLTGSQINLATRDKRPTPAVQYPFNHRPGSANNVAITINRSSLALRNRPKRPQSADTFILRNNSKSGYNFVGENCGEKLKVKRPLSSSSNLLNILLSEQIKRSRSTPEPDLRSDCSLGDKIKTRTSSQMDLHSDGGGGSSIEEDIRDESNDKDNGTYRRNSLPIRKMKKSNPRIAANSLKKDTKHAQSDSAKKFVTFGNTQFVENNSLSGHSANSGSDNQEKPDLPGRVSFSKSDVFEVDFSDYDNDDELLANYSNSANRSSFGKFMRSSANVKTTHDDCVEQQPSSDNFCCALKCNSMASTIDECDSTSTDKIIESKNGNSDSNAVIEEYKKEIESLNRKHENEMAETEESFHSARLSPTKDDHVPKLQLKHSSGDGATSVAESSHTTNRYNDKTPFNHSKNVNLLNFKPLNNNNNNNNGNSEHNVKSTSNEVINNYLKATNQNDIYTQQTTSKQNNLSKTPKPTKMSKKVKQPDRAKSKSKPGECLDEFHMEKVESWMSIHEKRFSDSHKCDTGESGAYSHEWRETPNSKTDDEGNFSFEDPIDDASNEESNYDEIVSVIKEIDEEKSKDLEAMEHMGGVASSASTLKLKTSARSTTPDKMAEILSYLDNVDSTCIKTMQETFSYKIPESFRSDIEFAVEPDVVGDMPKIADLVILPNHQLARRIVALTLRANELSNAIQLSKEHMAHVRADKQKAIRIEKQHSQARMAEQKNHFESIVSRHQGFIEQLLKDKALLCEKVSALTRRIESQNQAWEHKLQTEIVRVKESTIAGEKIRRERWVRENTKKIKELTVKGLEDEINKMTCNHQKEITELKRQHQQDILDAVEKTRQKHEIMEMGIRDTYAQDREAAIEKERSAIRERFERQMAFEQRTFHEEKSKMMAEFVHDKDRLYTEFKEKEQDFERRRDEYVFEKNQEIHFLKKELREKIALNEKKYQTELASVREQFESDFVIWRREQEAAFKIREVEKENAIRNQCRIERDKQIDDIVAKVDAEALKTQKDSESKILRLKEKYENDLQNLEQTERLTREKYNETRTKLAECEANKQNMQSTVKQLELQLSHAQKMCDEFLREKENMKENARKEIELEVSNLKKERDNEIERIYARVQQAIEKKDATFDMFLLYSSEMHSTKS